MSWGPSNDSRLRMATVVNWESQSKTPPESGRTDIFVVFYFFILYFVNSKSSHSTYCLFYVTTARSRKDETRDSNLSTLKSKSSMVKGHFSFKMSLLKRVPWWASESESRISMMLPTVQIVRHGCAARLDATRQPKVKMSRRVNPPLMMDAPNSSGSARKEYYNGRLAPLSRKNSFKVSFLNPMYHLATFA